MSSKIDQSDLWHLGGLESQPPCQACPASSRQLLRPQAAQAQVRDPTGEMDSPGETGAMKFHEVSSPYEYVHVSVSV